MKQKSLPKQQKNSFLNPSLFQILATVITILIAVFGFYKSYIQSPELTFSLGPQVEILYNDEGLEFYVPIDVKNSSSKPGTITDCNIKFISSNFSGEYEADWDSFCIINHDPNFDPPTFWQNAGLAGPFSVAGQSYQSKTVKFYIDINENFHFEVGKYLITFIVKEESPIKETVIRFNLDMTKDKVDLLEKRKNHSTVLFNLQRISP